jgi:hypothetical protein
VVGTSVKVTGVDPRTGGWEQGRPSYCVSFWEDGGPTGRLSSDEYEIADASDVHEVIEWANAESSRRKSMHPEAGHSYTLYVVSQRRDRPADEGGLILIAGIDPSEVP